MESMERRIPKLAEHFSRASGRQRQHRSFAF